MSANAFNPSPRSSTERRSFLNGRLVEHAVLEGGGPSENVLADLAPSEGPPGDGSRALAAFTGLAALASVLAAARKDGCCARIFIAGAVSHIGKTTVCLGILAALRKAGLTPQELAYIKPATQCEAPDLLSRWCEEEGVEHVSGQDAPLVFYSGFTRSFLMGEQGTSAQWLAKISARVDELAVGRRVVIVDGVGFPAVGSIVGVDNADVALASRAPVVIVCKSGVGGAIDAFNLNRSYFLAKKVPVLGAIFNFGELDGFYSWESCAESIQLWFGSDVCRREHFYGVIPKSPELDGLRERISATSALDLRRLADLNSAHIAAYLDLAALLGDVLADPWCRKATSRFAKLDGKRDVQHANQKESLKTQIKPRPPGGGGG